MFCLFIYSTVILTIGIKKNITQHHLHAFSSKNPHAKKAPIIKNVIIVLKTCFFDFLNKSRKPDIIGVTKNNAQLQLHPPSIKKPQRKKAINDKRNNNYFFVKEYYECGLKHLHQEITKEVSKSYVSDNTLNDIIYGVTNDVISQYDRCGKQLVFEKK